MFNRAKVGHGQSALVIGVALGTIAGYYGALARWFDYALLDQVAQPGHARGRRP